MAKRIQSGRRSFRRQDETSDPERPRSIPRDGARLPETMVVQVTGTDPDGDAVARMRTLRQLLDEKLITTEEYEARRKVILESV